MIEIKYKSSDGREYNLVGDRMRAISGSFHSYKWKPKTQELNYGDRVSGFGKNSSNYELTIDVRGEEEERRTIMNNLTESFEHDILKEVPGRVFFGSYYNDVYITESDTGPSDQNVSRTKRTILIYCPYPFWIREETKQFFPQSSVDVSDGLDYDFDYEFDYAPEQAGVERWYIDHYAPSDFNMIIFGPCVDPKILVNGYPYQIYTELEESDYLIIDSRKHEITKHMANGTTANLYNSRSFEHSVFEKIPCGDVIFNWPGNFGFDVTLFLERSEPEFGSGSAYIETETGKYMITE